MHASLACGFAAGCSREAAQPPGGPSGNPIVTAAPPIQVDLPLLDALWELDPVIRERFPGEFREGIATVGVFFARTTELKRGDSHCTPRNSVAFAWSGGDGEHYSLIVREGRVNADSPVILTAPANSGDENHLLAESFQNFLRLGIRRGFFGLSQFAYNPKAALAVYGNPEEHPAGNALPASADEDRQRQVLAFIAESLKLEPLTYTPEEYRALQASLADRLDGR